MAGGSRRSGSAPERDNLALRAAEEEVLTALRAQNHVRAEALARKAIARFGQVAELINMQGVALYYMGQYEAAAARLRRALQLKPEAVRWASNLGLAYTALNRPQDALAAFETVLARYPDEPELLGNYGQALKDAGRFEAAAEVLMRATELAPTQSRNFSALAGVLLELDEAEAAIDSYRRAIAIRPDNAVLHHNYAIALLRQGLFDEGWREHDWRFRTRDKEVRDYGVPPWQGESLEGVPIRAWGEQGVGDQILYASMLPDLVALGAEVHVQCDPRLHPLLRRSLPALASLHGFERPPEEALGRYQVAFGSLGGHFRRDAGRFGEGAPFLRADPAARARLRAKYERLAKGRPVLGVAWRSANKSFGTFKSMRLTDLAPIVRDRPAFLVNLQYGDCRAELGEADRMGLEVYDDPEIDQMKDLDGFASQIAALDGVISVSNTTVHMAGALGVPTLVMLTRGKGIIWYWFLERTDSPWYRSLRLFRQAEKGAWDGVISAVAATVRAGWPGA